PLGTPRPITHFSRDALESHSSAVARTAGCLVTPGEDAEYAFTAGLLHDIGKLVLAAARPAELGAVLGEAVSANRPLHELEAELCGVTHAETGAYLLALWGLPSPIVDAVARHHSPAEVGEPSLDAAGAVAVANALVAELEPRVVNRGAAPGLERDIADADLARWRAVAARETAATPAA